jgi:hypothetical protein
MSAAIVKTSFLPLTRYMGLSFKTKSEVESGLNVHPLPPSIKSYKRFPEELFFVTEAYCAHNSRMFGEMGIVRTKKKIQGKLRDRGTVFMFVGYTPNIACYVNRMLNLKTKHIIKSRDIVWLNKSFGEWDKKVGEVQ